MKILFLVTLSVLTILFASCNSTGATNKNSGKQLSTSIKQLPANQVCMINNKFMDKEQIKVPFDGKDYYGCCEACVAGLKGSAASRTATDPLTGKSVDKATAFIIIKPGSKDEVLYFNSKDNANKFLEQKN